LAFYLWASTGHPAHRKTSGAHSEHLSDTDPISNVKNTFQGAGERILTLSDDRSVTLVGATDKDHTFTSRFEFAAVRSLQK